MQSFWILAATFSTTLTYAFMKMIGTDCAFYEIFFVRSLFLMAATGCLVAGAGVSLKTRHPWLHLRRVAAGIAALSLNIIVVQHLPLGTAQTLAYTAPLFVAGSAVGLALRRGGRIAPRLLTAVVLGFVGVCLVMRPQASEGELVWGGAGAFLRLLRCSGESDAENVGQRRRTGGENRRVLFDRFLCSVRTDGTGLRRA